MRKFPRHGHGRIYCLHKRDIPKVEKIIKEMDEFEHTYLPEDMIAVHQTFPSVIPTGKFDDLDLNELTANCWQAGVPIWVFIEDENT